MHIQYVVVGDLVHYTLSGKGRMVCSNKTLKPEPHYMSSNSSSTVNHNAEYNAEWGGALHLVTR